MNSCLMYHNLIFFRSGTDKDFSEKKCLLQELVDLEAEGTIIVEEKKNKAKENKLGLKKKKVVDMHDSFLKPSTSGTNDIL